MFTQGDNHISATAPQPHIVIHRERHFYKIIHFIIKLTPETGQNHILKTPISPESERDLKVKGSGTVD